MNIDQYVFSGPWILAPMSGVSDVPFRILAREMGASAAPTALISASGLVHDQSETKRLLAHHPSEQPFWVQIFGGDPDTMAAAAQKAVILGARIIDINMGCPVKKVIKTGGGAALGRNPKLAAEIVKRVKERSGVPVTAKIRSGWDEYTINANEMVQRLADAGCAAVALHARTRTQGYSGGADWGLIGDVVSKSPIPIIGNGDVINETGARQMLDQTGCAGVMVGRAALGNPWFFRALRGGDVRPTPTERFAVVHRHFLAHLETVPQVSQAVRSFRPHLVWYSRSVQGASRFRNTLMQTEDIGELETLCREFFLREARVAGASGSHQEIAEGRPPTSAEKNSKIFVDRGTTFR